MYSALKLRYLLPITGPVPDNRLGATPSSTPLSSPMRARFNYIDEEPVSFDAPLVARLGEGWEDSLETILFRWVDVIVGEQRGER